MPKFGLKFAEVWLKFIGGYVRDSGLILDEFCDPEISGRPRGVTGACDKGV